MAHTSASAKIPRPEVGAITPPALCAAPSAARAPLLVDSLLAAEPLVARSFSHHVLGDHVMHDLARPLVDLRDLRVAVVPLRREVTEVPVATEDLHALARRAHGGVRGEELGHRGLDAERLTLVLEGRRAPGEPPGGVELRGH